MKIIKKHGFEIDLDKIPRHIAIILDGNGRWARKRNLPRIEGHRAGVSNLKKILEIARDLKISIVTIFVFSKENWKRPRNEINFLMRLIVEFVDEELEDARSKGIRIVHSGSMERLPAGTKRALHRALRETEKNNKFIFNIALNYSGRQEIVDASKRMIQDIRNGNLKSHRITEAVFRKYIYHPEFPDPELLIRTSGELRISNFLLWESTYSELYFTKTLWPDFKEREFFKAIHSYQERERRFGGVK